MFLPVSLWWSMISLTGATDYLHEWLAEIPGGLSVAQIVARDYGHVVVKELQAWPNIFHLVKEELEGLYDIRAKRHLIENPRSNRISQDRRISWAQREKVLSRSKRDFLQPFRRLIVDEESFFDPLPMVKKENGTEFNTSQLVDLEAFNDPLWNTQWYLQSPPIPANRSMRALDEGESVSLNVQSAWKAGFTGKGIVVTILDDGLETNHSDLAVNYDPEASTNINGNNRDPTPRYDHPEETHHGTRCAGEVAMQANNNICGVGIAHNARIGGIRMLDGVVTDRVEAESLSFNSNYIDIYSSSWGPSDNGKAAEKPGVLAARALERGVTEGRKGKGSLFVWASGNGGINGDSCAYDGYASNIYTLSIGSTTEHGHIPIYAEHCSSTIACTYSSGSYREGKIISTDVLNRCTSGHTGVGTDRLDYVGLVSVILPSRVYIRQKSGVWEHVGIFYLLLRRSNLTWRDVKHLVIWTSDPFTLLHTPGWYVNGVGMLVHPVFGFGLMDTGKLIEAGATWQTVPPKNRCAVRKAGVEDSVFSSQRALVVPIVTKACQDTDSEIRFLEHVEIIVSLSHVKRGAVQIYLQSPMGTTTLIAPKRPYDFSTSGLVEWPFVSVHNWGENPLGVWKVTFESHCLLMRCAYGSAGRSALKLLRIVIGPLIDDLKQNNSSIVLGALQSLRIVFHGTKEEPLSTKILREKRKQQTTDALAETNIT